MANSISNLPKELADEILCRVPVTSLRRIRCRCKKWETLFKDGYFTKKHRAHAQASAERKGEILAVLLINYKLYLTSVNLHGIRNDSDPSVRIRANLISLNDSDKLDITRVYHCDVLLLCIGEEYNRLVLWNPYTGETRWISVQRPADHSGMWYNHALGYKILRFVFVVQCGFGSGRAYFIGENDYFRQVDLGETPHDDEVFPRAFSYVPTSVQINHPP